MGPHDRLNHCGFAEALLARLPLPPPHDVAERIAGVAEDGRGWWPEIGEQRHDRVCRKPLTHLPKKFQEIPSHFQGLAGGDYGNLRSRGLYCTFGGAVSAGAGLGDSR